MFSREGSAVIVNYFKNKDKADAVVAEIAEAGGEAVAMYGDVTSKEDMVEMVAKAEAHFGKKVSVLVNNALASYQFNPSSPQASIKTVTIDHMDQQMKGASREASPLNAC